MLVDYLNTVSEKAILSDVKETFKELSLKLLVTDFSWDIVSHLLSELKNIPERDDFELVLDVNGNIETVTVISDDNIELLKEHFEQDEVIDFSIELIIQKKTDDNSSSIYLISEFENYIRSTDLTSLIISLNRVFKEFLVFEVQGKIQGFGSNTIKFIPANESANIICIPDREYRLNIIRENSTQLVDDVSFLADDFFLINRSTYKEINCFFDSMITVLSLAALANTSSLNNYDEIKFKINGYKTLDVPFTKIDSLSYDFELLYKIISWVFKSGQCNDKLGLIRNILSLHVDSAGVVEINKQTWMAIQSNYEIYLKDNIQQYIEIKNKITDFIFNYNTKIYELSDQFLNTFRGNLVAIISFIISVVIVNGFKDSGVKTIFSSEYLYIVISIFVISSIWMVFSRSDLASRANNTEKNIKSVLFRNYRNILINDEIDSYIEPAFTESRSYLSQQVRKYTIAWVSILISFVLIFVIGYFLFSEQVKLSSTTKDNLVKVIKPIVQIDKGTKSAFEKTKVKSINTPPKKSHTLNQ